MKSDWPQMNADARGSIQRLGFLRIRVIRVQKLSDVVINFGINEYRPNDGFFGFPPSLRPLVDL